MPKRNKIKIKTLWEGLKIVKTCDKETPYRLVKGNVDHTPELFTDRRRTEIQTKIDKSDILSCFFPDNFLIDAPLLLVNEPKDYKDSVYKHISSDVNELLRKGKDATPLRDLKVDSRLINAHNPSETFTIRLLETTTTELFSYESAFIYLEPYPLIEHFESLSEQEEDKKSPQKVGEKSKGAKLDGLDPTTELKHENSMESLEDLEENSAGEEDLLFEATMIFEEDEISGIDPELRYGSDQSESDESDKATDDSPDLDSTNVNVPDVCVQPFHVSCSSTAPSSLQKDIGIVTDQIERSDQHTFASSSDINDTFSSVHSDNKTDYIQNKLEERHRTNNAYLKNASTCVLVSQHFDYVFNIVERTLENNYFRKEQTVYRLVHLNDDAQTRPSLTCVFSLTLPINISNNRVREVTSLCWHPLNQNLLGVGYGKIHSEKQAGGLVCLWNLKNPTLPERMYKFEHAVTCITFSKIYPYTLVIGFYNGHLAILNILAREKTIFYNTFKFVNENFPVTHLCWFESGASGNSFPVSSSKSGAMHSYKIDIELYPELLLALPQKHVQPKGIKQYSRYYHSMTDSLAISPGISTFTQYPVDNLIYLVGTDDGCIHICSARFKSKGLDVFAAHEGPINNIEFHPTVNKLFLTCGNDPFIRIWAFSIFQPILAISARQESVQCAKWYTHNPMLIIAISEKFIDIWDLRRINNAVPVFTLDNNGYASYSAFNISPHYPNIMVGDIKGGVHLFIFNETSVETNFEVEVLARSFRDHIKSSDSKLWDELENVIPEFKFPFIENEFIDILDSTDA